MGPEDAFLGAWIEKVNEAEVIGLLYGAKLTAIIANRKRALILRAMLYVQGATVLVGVLLAVKTASGM